MEQTNEKKNRSRRSKQTLQRDILDAIARIIQRQGFSNINLSLISQESGVDINTIVRNFGSIEKLLEQYVHNYDYWAGAIVEDYDEAKDSMEEFYEKTLMRFIDFLYKNKEIQKLLIWELTEENRITINTSQRRESIYKKLIHSYNKLFEHSDIPFDTITAIIIAGVYYLVLHRKLSTFFGVDYSTKKGKKQLTDTITFLIENCFSSLKERNLQLDTLAK
jgi:AcrR family transcriptional regulator